MKERNVFLASVLATSLAISTFKIYNKSGQIDKEALEGFINLVSASFDDTEKLIIKKTDDKVNQCECNGAKIIVHGDGHRTPCPCTGTSSGCKCSKSQSQVTQQEKFIKIFTRPNCVHCDRWKAEQKQKFENAGWKVDEGYGDGLVPFFELVKGNKKTVKVGFTTLEEAEKLINE
jgi:hypothetical protein